MPVTLFTALTEQDKSEAIKNLVEHSSPRQEFFLMMVLSSVMAALGVILDSSAIIIGSMLIAPLLYPILSLSLGIVIADGKVISRSFWTIIKSVFLAVLFAAVIALFFAPTQYASNPELLSRTEPSLAFAAVAVIAGMAASFALVKPQLSETLPGIAISVALIPPVAVMGIALSKMNFIMFRNSFLVFFVNIVGIIFANMIVFSMMNLYVKKKRVVEEVKKDEKIIEKEKEMAEAKAEADTAA